MFASATPPNPIEVFYSYAHGDERFLSDLLNHLGILRRLGVIRDWHDRKITAGSEWKGQIDRHLDAAGVILLLVSADFINSDYCWDVELKRALERHDRREACVIPVILRHVDHWHAAPFGKLGAAPTDGRPVTDWPNQDQAFANVAGHIRRAVEELRNPRPPEPSASRSEERSSLTDLPSTAFTLTSVRPTSSEERSSPTDLPSGDSIPEIDFSVLSVEEMKLLANAIIRLAPRILRGESIDREQVNLGENRRLTIVLNPGVFVDRMTVMGLDCQLKIIEGHQARIDLYHRQKLRPMAGEIAFDMLIAEAEEELTQAYGTLRSRIGPFVQRMWSSR